MGSAHMEDYNEAFQVYYGLTKSLNRLRDWLQEKERENTNKTNIDPFLNDWIDISGDLPTQAVKNTLLLMHDPKDVTSLEHALTYVSSLANHWNTLLVHCRNGREECNLQKHLKLLYNGEFIMCFTYDPLEGFQGELKEATSQGES